MSREAGIGNRNAPNKTFAVFCLKLLADRRRDIKYGECAGDVKEQGSKGKMSARTNPAIDCVAASEKRSSPGDGAQRVPSA